MLHCLLWVAAVTLGASGSSLMLAEKCPSPVLRWNMVHYFCGSLVTWMLSYLSINLWRCWWCTLSDFCFHQCLRGLMLGAGVLAPQMLSVTLGEQVEGLH